MSGGEEKEVTAGGFTVNPGDALLEAPSLVLCPCCCTIGDILSFKYDPEGEASQAKCARCSFTFPVLPPEAAELTLAAMHEHDCLLPAEQRGNWDAVGKEINQQMRLKGISQAELGRRLREVNEPKTSRA